MEFRKLSESRAESPPSIGDIASSSSSAACRESHRVTFEPAQTAIYLHYDASQLLRDWHLGHQRRGQMSQRLCYQPVSVPDLTWLIHASKVK
jgi:hypothetical protein